MQYIIHSLSDIETVAAKIIKALGEFKVIAFYGSMGAGKTTLIKAICKQLGCIEEATSPTFALVNEYATESGDSVFHFDFYRIEKDEELFDIGYEDYIYGDSLCFIEWPEKAEHLIPETAAKIIITVKDDNTRSAEIVLPK